MTPSSTTSVDNSQDSIRDTRASLTPPLPSRVLVTSTHGRHRHLRPAVEEAAAVDAAAAAAAAGWGLGT